MTKLHAPPSEQLLVGQMQAHKERLETFVNKIFNQAVEDGLTFNDLLVCISSLHTAVLDTPKDIKLKALKELK